MNGVLPGVITQPKFMVQKKCLQYLLRKDSNQRYVSDCLLKVEAKVDLSSWVDFRHDIEWLWRLWKFHSTGRACKRIRLRRRFFSRTFLPLEFDTFDDAASLVFAFSWLPPARWRLSHKWFKCTQNLRKISKSFLHLEFETPGIVRLHFFLARLMSATINFHKFHLMLILRLTKDSLALSSLTYRNNEDHAGVFK